MRKKNTEEMIEKMASFDYQLTRAERTKLYNLARSSNSFIRARTAEALSKVETKQSRDILYHLSYDKDEIVRTCAVEALADAGFHDNGVLQRVKQLCEDSESLVRLYAVTAYFDIRLQAFDGDYDEYCIIMQPFLEDLFSKESNEYVMISIMECLCYTGKTLYKDRIKQIYHQNESSAPHNYRMEAITEGTLKRIVEWERSKKL